VSNTNSVDTITFEMDVLRSDIPVLVDFWASWCVPCLRAAPEVEAVAEELRSRLKVFKLDVDISPQLAQEYNVRSIPTLILFKGGQFVDKIVGAVPRDTIIEKLQMHL